MAWELAPVDDEGFLRYDDVEVGGFLDDDGALATEPHLEPSFESSLVGSVGHDLVAGVGYTNSRL